MNALSSPSALANLRARLCVAGLLACLALSSVALTGCSKPDKPKELLEIEALWQDPATRKVKDIPGAELYYRESRQFRYDAQEAYEDGEVELAREYAIWSRLRYRTAIAVAKQYAAKERLDAANAKVATRNPELTAINQERNKLNEEVGELERQVAVARRKKEDAEKRRTSGGTTTFVSSGKNEAELASMADDKIRQVESARSEATAVRADENAASTFNRAENLLKSLRALRAQKPIPYDQISSSAETAISAYRDAAREAQPGFKEQVAKEDPEARRKALAAAAQDALGAQNASLVGEAVLVIAPSSFESGGSSPNSGGRTMIDAIVKLAKNYDEFSLSIEAYTAPGDATENLAVSQLRARKIEDALVEAGIDKGRITSAKGQGQENVRYPDQKSRNERFEITFRR